MWVFWRTALAWLVMSMRYRLSARMQFAQLQGNSVVMCRMRRSHARASWDIWSLYSLWALRAALVRMGWGGGMGLAGIGTPWMRIGMSLAREGNLSWAVKMRMIRALSCLRKSLAAW